MNSAQVKQSVVTTVAGSKNCVPSGVASYRIDGTVLHVRFCSKDQKDSGRYKFNINPNTLRADWECWICGDRSLHYLIPTEILRSLYDDPRAYVDSHHPAIRVVSVDAMRDEALYARGGKRLDLKQYRGRNLG
jgi:hypothetical protein